MFGENPLLAFLGIFVVGPMVLAALLRMGLRRLGWQSRPVLDIVLTICVVSGYAFLTIIAVLISKYDIYLAGYGATSFWVMVSMGAAGIVAIFPWANGIGRYLMPFVGGLAFGIAALFGYIHFDDNRHSLYYEDDQYRIEDIQWLTGHARYTLFVHNEFFDEAYPIGRDTYGDEFTLDGTEEIEIEPHDHYLTVRIYGLRDSIENYSYPRVFHVLLQ